MLEEKLLAEFADRLEAEISDKATELDPGTPLTQDTALAEVVLGYLEEAGLVSEHDLCPHEDTGRKRSRILGYSLPDDASRLELFTGRYIPPGEPATLTRSELGKLTGWGARFFAYAASGDHERFGQSESALAAARRIRSELGRIESVRVHVLTNAAVRDRDVNAITIDGRDIEFSVWDLERLHRASGEEVTRDRIDIDFKKLLGRPIACLEMKPSPSEYQTFLLILPGELIYELYEEYGARLFEFNVRSFLQTTGQVNKGIRDTIRDQPSRFLAYNNGLTATADEIEAGAWEGGTVIHRIRGLQIVNGAQTTASIHRAKKTEKLAISGVVVAMKLTRVAASKLDEFVPLIARYANTQNPVQLADLSANSAFHIRLEQLAHEVWCPGEESRWFYERARGAYQVARVRYGSTPAKRREFDAESPKRQKFGKTDLAKYLMSWWQLPHTVSKGAQKNFSAFMVELQKRYGAGWVPDVAFFKLVIALALIFKGVQAAVRRAKLQSYGANVVTYLIAKLAADHGTTLDLEAVWEAQEISPEFAVALDGWVPAIHAEIVAGAGKQNVTEWCKKEGCWDRIQSLSLPAASALTPELIEAHADDEPVTATTLAGAQDGPNGADPVVLCCSLDGAAWARVIAWAAAPGCVADFDRQVAHTVSGLALRGWQQRPSPKQAVRGARVIDAARRAGVVPPA